MSIVTPRFSQFPSPFIRMQGETSAPSTGPEEQRQHGKWKAGSEPHSLLFQNKIPTIYSELLCPSVPTHKETGNFRGKNGGLVSYMMAQEAMGVAEGAGRRRELAWPQSSGGTTPLFLFSEEVIRQEKVLLPWKTTCEEKVGLQSVKTARGALAPSH